MRDLFSLDTYPDSMATRSTRRRAPSCQGDAHRADSLRGRVLAALHRQNLTTDECACELRESVLAIPSTIQRA